MNRNFWRGKRVFLTGHTGFKGGWLALWLSDMGAKVFGYALRHQHENGIYSVAEVSGLIDMETIGDVRDKETLQNSLNKAQPELIIHLAAQPLVRKSYLNPIDTFSVNTMGLINLLEVAKTTETVKAIVNVTTDKCYENNQTVIPHVENEKLGGKDPYSASKACAEIISACYRSSYFDFQEIALATARAGNVIGGGDEAEDRLIPDFFRSIRLREPIILRNPSASRPWQHVLEPLSGYLKLSELLLKDGKNFSEAFNFGPIPKEISSVENIVKLLIDLYRDGSWKLDKRAQPFETQTLALDSSKAKDKLGWTPRWNINEALSKTVDWHKDLCNGCDMAQTTIRQISDYENSLK